MDVSVIEIQLSSKDIDFLEIDKNIFENNFFEIYQNKLIYILQYPKGEKLAYSVGLLKSLIDKEIKHSCSTDYGSSGSPILCLENHKVIGIHKQRSSRFNYNIGTFIKFAINEFIKAYPKNEKNYIEKKNYIEMILENNEENEENKNVIFNPFNIVNNSIRKNLSLSGRIQDLKDTYIELYVNNIKYIYNENRNFSDEILNIKIIIKEKITEGMNIFSTCNNYLKSVNLKSFDASNITNMDSMFSNCQKIESLDLSNFDTKNVIYMRNMFSQCSNLKSLNISNFNTENVIYMDNMFSGCKNLLKLDLLSFNTKKVINMSCMFALSEKLITLDLSSFDVINVINLKYMFNGCKNLENINLSSFKTDKVINMSGMFCHCESLKNINLSSFNTEKVTDLSDMFVGCKNIISLDLSYFNTKNVINMSMMFGYCYNLKNLNISNFNTNKTEKIEDIFLSCDNLSEIIDNKNNNILKIKNEFDKENIIDRIKFI